MRASAVPTPLIGLPLLGLTRGQTFQAVEDKLGYAERGLPKLRRDRRSRQAQAFADRRQRQLGQRINAAGGEPVDDPAWLRAVVDYLRATIEVMRAETDAAEYRTGDPVAALEGDIAHLESRIATVERGNAELALRERNRERASAMRELGAMATADYQRLSAARRAELERQLGLDLPTERVRSTDALGREPLLLNEQLMAEDE